MPLERELKFSLLEEQFPSLDELRLVFGASDYSLEPGPTVQQHDRYYDDARQSLKKQGLALRRRTLNGKRFATLKRQDRVQDALHEYDELEVPLTGGEWPGPIQRRVSLVTDPAHLRSVLDINTHRVGYRVLQRGEPVAQLLFDEVSAGYPGSDQSVHFTEAEIEALGTRPLETLRAVADVVDRAVRLAPNTVNKVERAEALLSLGASFHND